MPCVEADLPPIPTSNPELEKRLKSVNCLYRNHEIIINTIIFYCFIQSKAGYATDGTVFRDDWKNSTFHPPSSSL